MKGAVVLKNNFNSSSSGNMDEGRNETTRLPYTDSISVPASEETLKKNKKAEKK